MKTVSKYPYSKKGLWLVGIIPILALVGFTLVQLHRHPKTESVLEEVRSPGGFVAKGLRIEEHLDGQRAFSLELDNLRVVGKKAGFFRLGFWRVARLENVRINLYQQPNKATTHGDGETLGTQNAVSAVGPDLTGLFTRNDKLKRMLPKGVKGIEMVGVTINVYYHGKVISSLSSKGARMDSRGKGLAFEGAVKMVSRDGLALECGKMAWSADRKTLTTLGPFLLKTKEETVRGQGLETDLALEQIMVAGRRIG